MSFDLADLLAGVPRLDFAREQIEYIPLDRIEADPNNFYQLSGIEELAANIQLCGLQQPIRVRPIPGAVEKYRIVSGHRRYAALTMLSGDDPERWDDVACIVEDDEASDTLQQLRLISANANTRTMSSAETSEQALRVENLLYRLKEEEGYEFPGRMREHVAKAVGVSKSKLARLKVIRDNLAFEWQQPWKDDRIGESVAYALAQLPKAWQRMIYSGCSDPRYLYEGTVQEYARRFREIEATACGDNKDMVCGHKTVMMELSCKERCSDPCKARCCWSCCNLRTCKRSCPAAAGRKKDQQAAYKTANAALAEELERTNRPKREAVDALWQRFGLARALAGVDLTACMKAMDVTYCQYDVEKVMKLECGEAKVTADTQLPYKLYHGDVARLTALADALSCSLDYLLCRTDAREVGVSGSGTGWHSGNPEAYGTYAAYVRITDAGKTMLRELLWDGEDWYMFGAKISEDATVICWCDRPEVI